MVNISPETGTREGLKVPIDTTGPSMNYGPYVGTAIGGPIPTVKERVEALRKEREKKYRKKKLKKAGRPSWRR
jgi:hypothetical protein